MLSILGAGHAYGDSLIDNTFIEDLDVGTSEEWILEKIGIETRRTTLPLDYIRNERNARPELAATVASRTPTDLGLEAARLALKRAGIEPSALGLVICNCCAPNATVPVEAQRIAAALHVECPAYDVFTACPAFALHMDFLNHFEEEALPDYVLCVSTAALTQHVNYNDRSDSAIWADGAAAWVVSPRKKGKLQLLYSDYMADPRRWKAVVVDTNRHFHQDGRAVRDFSVRQTVRLVRRLEEQFAIDWTRDIFIGHQANATMLRQITNNRKIPETNHWHNVTSIGNQAGAGAPAVLSEHWEKVEPGQKIVVAVLGAGLSWGSLVLEAL